MPHSEQRLAKGIADTIRDTVADTLEMMFNTSVAGCENLSKKPSFDDVVCYSEFLQDDMRAHILFLFDHSLIEKFVRDIFPPSSINDPSSYESTAMEIVNIVGNSIKKFLNANGYHFQMAIPVALDRYGFSPTENPMIQMAFSFKNNSAMGVDFYMRAF